MTEEKPGPLLKTLQNLQGLIGNIDDIVYERVDETDDNFKETGRIQEELCVLHPKESWADCASSLSISYSPIKETVTLLFTAGLGGTLVDAARSLLVCAQWYQYMHSLRVYRHSAVKVNDEDGLKEYVVEVPSLNPADLETLVKYVNCAMNCSPSGAWHECIKNLSELPSQDETLTKEKSFEADND